VSNRQRLLHIKNNTPKGRACTAAEQRMSAASLGTPNVDEFSRAVTVFLQSLAALDAVHSTRNARRRRFDELQAKQSATAAVVRSIAPNPSTVVVIGSAQFPATFRGMQASPVRRIQRLMAKFRRVVQSPEAYTTARCSCCCDVTSITWLVLGADSRPVHGLRICSSCLEILGRDPGASRSIGNGSASAFLYGGWPAYLHHSTYDSKAMHAAQQRIPIDELKHWLAEQREQRANAAGGGR
jgi:hypothetical protein